MKEYNIPGLILSVAPMATHVQLGFKRGGREIKEIRQEVAETERK